MSHDLTGKSVLVVDDEPGLRKLLKLEFEDFNADVTLADSGQAAFELLKEKNFDIVFTDMKMPNGDGMWLISQIREELDHIPDIYLCSGYSKYSDEDIEMLGIVKMFHKPFDFMTVVAEVIEYTHNK